MAFPRAVLANLETGRRPSVSVAELLILAAALDVPPAVLVAPLGRRERTEILPGVDPYTADAINWIAGRVGIAPEAQPWRVIALDRNDLSGVVLLYQRHSELVMDLTDENPPLWLGEHIVAAAREAGDTVTPQQALRMQRENMSAELDAIRWRMFSLDLTPPPLPDELSYIDDEQPEA